jgi:tetratricopeptide (TPR) repeat protein
LQSLFSDTLQREPTVGHKQTSNGTARPVKHIVAAAGLVVILLLLIWHTALAGFSSLLTAYAAQSKDIDAANLAVRMNSSDSEALYVRGTVLEARNDMRGAAAAYNQAVLARPDDCVSWLGLARTRELSGETDDAIAAARQSVPLAPYYAQPHWQLGNILLRAGQRDEAFKELRFAAASNPTLIAGVIDLAWRISGGNVQFLKQAIQPQTPEAYETLGRFLRHQGDLNAALTI